MNLEIGDHLFQLGLAIVAGLPGAIAAWSSFQNGREQKRVKEELRETNGKLHAIARGQRIGRN